MVDAITTLMMVVLLVLMFFVLCFLNVQDKWYEKPGDSYNHNAYNPSSGDELVTPTPTLTITPTPTPIPEDDEDYGGGGFVEPTPIPSPVPTVFDGEADGFNRAAVYAVLIDEETGLVIETPEVVFELYNAAGVRQTLDTHYPELISYTSYETTEDGDFYLPEKISYGSYYLHQMTEVEGYDFAGDVYFEVNESYEWSDPLVVQIPLGAAKNNIQVQINDGVTELGLPNVIFDVISDGDNITPDGSIRYTNGEIVDTIECDDTGYGVSHELYIGDFRLVPRNLPFGYAAPELTSREINLPRRSMAGEYAPLTVMASFKTQVNLTVVDELSPSVFVEGATYVLTSDDEEPRTFVTNGAGHISIDDLSKNTTYRLIQTGTVSGYILNENVYDFTVDSLGYINNASNYIIDATNRILRVEISTVDRITRTQLSGYAISLSDNAGNVITSWESDGTLHSVEGLEPGLYTLNIESNNSKVTIKVEDVSEIQKFSNSVMTSRSYMVIGGIAILIVAIIVIGIHNLIVWHRRNRKRKGGVQ